MARAAASASIRNGIGKVFTAVISVRTKPGATVVTRTPCRRSEASSAASSRIWCRPLRSAWATGSVRPRRASPRTWSPTDPPGVVTRSVREVPGCASQPSAYSAAHEDRSARHEDRRGVDRDLARDRRVGRGSAGLLRLVAGELRRGRDGRRHDRGGPVELPGGQPQGHLPRSAAALELSLGVHRQRWWRRLSTSGDGARSADAGRRWAALSGRRAPGSGRIWQTDPLYPAHADPLAARCCVPRFPRAPRPTGRLAGTTPAEPGAVSYTHLRAHETRHDLVCRL